MSQPPMIPRNSLGWLLLAQALVMLPLWPHVPLWMLGFWLACTLWRIQIWRMRARYPGKWLKGGLLLLTAAGVYFSSGGPIGLDAAAALLVATFILKLLEMQSPRDARVLIFLGFFCLAVAYLFDASLPWALYSLLPLAALLSALIGLQQARLIGQPMAPVRLALGLMAQAVPLMVLLFLFFPRLEPLWSLPLPGNGKAITGLNDRMSAADVAELGRSSEVAFRVGFQGAMPERRALYWRALSLDRFDGRTWSQSPQTALQPAPAWQKRGESLDYRVIQQPSGKPWLFALDVAQTDLRGVRQLSDFRLQRRDPVNQPLLYSVSSWPEAVREPTIAQWTLKQALQLPSGGDPRTREWANQLKAAHEQPEDLVKTLLSWFNQQDFHYTLKPATLGSDSIDDFLFGSRRGFCAHYAGAMTYVLRAAGVPARMVVGYQGGELNTAGNYLTVRQFEAHAWVEYWQPGIGWRSADPTAAVAPQRVEQGVEQALASDEGFLADSPFSPLRYRNLGWLNEVRLQWDNLNYGWQRWVLGYQGEQQTRFFQRWFRGLEMTVLAGGAVVLMGLMALLLLKPWQRRGDPRLRHFVKFERLLRRAGLARSLGEGPLDFAERAAVQLPGQAAAIRLFVQAFAARHYAGETLPDSALSQPLNTLQRQLAGPRKHSA